ncbi:TPA: restriction endonuclease subunit S [Campylobacter jejuni]|nr:restriction endonuclease subunit S [Campylobacter jejuni]HDZ5141604.1 restriction endonuclease subunit S [Campylobacter jejuni]HDZ5148920.1 restriction endonuclease subunit S [Campylobacter jejuni]
MKNFKDSGIEWLGEIPEHWEVVKIKHISEVVTGKTPALDFEWGDNMLFVTPTDCDLDKKYISSSLRKLSQKGIKNFDSLIIPKNSILVTCIASIGKVVINPEKVVTNQQINSVIPNLGLVSPDFIFYQLLVTMPFAERYFCGYSILPILNKSEFSNIKIPLPPLKEQEQIANFLDEKCEQIANFIEKKEKLISLLKEQKQALINETITKGLDKNVNFKDSGIEWLGEIPQHWEVKRLANFGTFLKGNGISRQDLVEDGESAILYGDIYTKYQIKTHFLYSKISKKTSLIATPIYNGDILFSGSGETKEDIGKNVVYLGDNNAFAGGDVIIFRQKENNALFLSYVLNTKYANFCKSIDSKGEIIVHIYASNLKDIKIPLPPLKEQEQIANFLDEKCEKIDLLIEKTKKQIKLIKEYKTTLINQAVCGRMDL